MPDVQQRCPACDRRVMAHRTCPACGYVFKLDARPIRGRKLTDRAFAAMLRRAAGGAEHHFTRETLFAAWLDKRGMIGRIALVMTILYVVAAALLVAGLFVNPVALFPLVIVSIVILSFRSSLVAKKERALMQEALGRWIRAGGETPGLIREPELGDAPPRAPEADVFDYGCEAIVIVDRDELVDLLVHNDFHVQRRALVLSQEGYPAHLEGRIKQLIEDAPEIPIFFLHGSQLTAGEQQERLEARLGVALSPERGIDLGVSPEDKRLRPAFRRVAAWSSDGHFSADALPWPAFSGLLGGAIENRQSLGLFLASAAATAFVIEDYG